MDQVSQANNHDAPPIMPVKRKRGRPRKDPSLKRKVDAPVPPGFGVFNGNQPRQVVPIENGNDIIVGQTVTGVVEAAFDAGYLLAVKIGNSNTSLRGVVFKPGHFVPISAENDVAPHVQMIRRNDIPVPMANQTRVRGRRPRSRERNKQHGNVHRIGAGHSLNGFPAANQVQIFAPQTTDPAASKGKHLLPMSAYAVPSVGSRGLVVPVVLQPVSLPNGMPLSNQMPPVQPQAGHTVLLNYNPVQTVTTHVAQSQSQTTHQVTAEGVQNHPTPDGVNNRVQVSSQSLETHIENSGMAAGKSSAEDSGLSIEGDSDTSEPLSVEPLRVIHTNPHNHSGPGANPFQSHRIGRMSELLQAVQDNIVENQVPQVENKATENDVGDEGSDQLDTPTDTLP